MNFFARGGYDFSLPKVEREREIERYILQGEHTTSCCQGFIRVCFYRPVILMNQKKLTARSAHTTGAVWKVFSYIKKTKTF